MFRCPDTTAGRLARACCRIAIISAALSRLAAAADASPAVRWNLQPPASALAQARALPTPPVSANTPIRDLLFAQHVQIDEAGVRRLLRRAIRFETAEGMDRHGTLVLPFDAGAETLVLHQVAVLGTDGSVTQFDPQRAQVIDTKTYDVYTDTFELVLPLPGLHEGAIAVLEVEEISERGRMDGPWMLVSQPRTAWPRDRFELAVEWGAGHQPRWSTDAESLDCGVNGNRLRCSADALPAYPLTQEFIWVDTLPQVVVSEAESWEAIVAAEHRNVAAARAGNAGVDAIHAELTAQAGDDAELLDRLHAFVSRGIRYVSASEGAHATRPHSPAATLANRYGDCKDKSILLIELLERSGWESWPVLVATHRYNADKLTLPGLWWFNHMLVCGRRPDGGAFCTDPTDPWTPAGTLAHNIQGTAALPLRPGGAPGLLPQERNVWRAEVQSDVVFDTAGGQLEEQERRYLGAYAGWQRSRLAGRTGEERRRQLVLDYQSTVSDLVEPEVEVEGLADGDEEVIFRSRARYTGLQDPAADLSYQELAAWLSALLQEFTSDNREHAYPFPGVHFRSVYRYTVPAQWQLQLGGHALDLQTRFGSAKREVLWGPEGDSRRIDYRTVIDLPATRVAPADIPAFNDFLNAIRAQTVIWFTGELTGTIAGDTRPAGHATD